MRRALQKRPRDKAPNENSSRDFAVSPSTGRKGRALSKALSPNKRRKCAGPLNDDDYEQRQAIGRAGQMSPPHNWDREKKYSLSCVRAKPTDTKWHAGRLREQLHAVLEGSAPRRLRLAMLISCGHLSVGDAGRKAHVNHSVRHYQSQSPASRLTPRSPRARRFV
jgi:hypothetical protein